MDFEQVFLTFTVLLCIVTVFEQSKNMATLLIQLNHKDVDGTYPFVLYINRLINPQVFTASQICQIRNHSDFKHFSVFISFFLQPTLTTHVYILLQLSTFLHQAGEATRGTRIWLDSIVLTFWPALFCFIFEVLFTSRRASVQCQNNSLLRYLKRE